MIFICEKEFEDGGWDAQGGADDGKLWQVSRHAPARCV